MTEHAPARQLEQLQAITDAALAHLPLDRLLDELLARVQSILGTDTAAILLLDDSGEQLIARAARGIEEEVERGVRVPVGAGFAGRIAATGVPVAIENLRPGEAVNPLLYAKGLKSLLGVPLLVEGEVIGVLHVGTRVGRKFGARDTELLQRAADRAALAIRARLSDRGRELADALQRALIPDPFPSIPGVEVEGRYLPAETQSVGGDWYDVFYLPGGLVGLAIGDVVGRGFAAAALMAQLRSGLRAYALDGRAPHEVVEGVNGLLRQLAPRSGATLLFAVFDPADGATHVCSAGHPPPLIANSDGSAALLALPTSVPIGASSYPRYESVRADLAPGSTLILYTDGLVERPGERVAEALERLRVAVEAAAPHGVTPICRAALAATPRPAHHSDDVALLAARWTPLARRFEVRLLAHRDAIPILRRLLSRWLSDGGASEREVGEIALACSEACANAIEHAYSPSTAHFEVSGHAEDGSVELRVRDFGRWRPPRGTHRGRGMLLMRGSMDSVEVETGEDGTTVVMRRRLGGAS